MPSAAPMMTSLWISQYDATIRQCKLPQCSVDTILGWSLATVKIQEKLIQYNCNDVISLSCKVGMCFSKPLISIL